MRRLTADDVKTYAQQQNLTVFELLVHAHRTIFGFVPRNGSIVNDANDIYNPFSGRVPKYMSDFHRMKKEPYQMPESATRTFQ